ncbi:YciI family protein [Amycolatopsis sp. FDAARGOS 1241]|uniref:YciI family protein n=1 Tax=Amycolatopsis sp. FDAARGOS 1241 TaxID=2778070 RepID=UPI00194FB3E4|nr:YciI family protein [Amycolatopsis sp. FDAARGOS 1241]QRP45607.1 hypothetical protein I6J71_41935 [Amycolatopsis sp. FDAARGOS 1241]
MKYTLTLHLDPALWETLPEAAKQEIGDGHGAFLKRHAAEIVGTQALGEPASSKTVRVRDGKPSSEQGLASQGQTFFCGYYVVDVENEARAVELAAEIPDAKYTAVEVRPIVFEA